MPYTDPRWQDFILCRKFCESKGVWNICNYLTRKSMKKAKTCSHLHFACKQVLIEF